MLGKKRSTSTTTATSHTMPPPPDPISPAKTSAPMVVDTLSEIQSFLEQAYLSPDVGSGDTAVVGMAAASAAQASGTGGAPGAVDLESLLNFWSPETPCSPIQPPPPSSTSFTSPALFSSSPFADVLHTPATDSYSSFGTSPAIVPNSPAQNLNLIDDLGFALFSDYMANSLSPTSESPAGPSSFKSTTDVLGLTSLTRQASWEKSSASSLSSVSPKSISNPPPQVTSPGSVSDPNSRSVSLPTGVRKNVTVRDLIPLDAPIQSRNYITPSATSRKEVPPSVARTYVPPSRKRSSAVAGLPSAEEMHDELAEEDPRAAEEERRIREMDPEKAALLQHVELARRRNTLAARKSRQRKLEHVRGLEELVERLQQENDSLKDRVKVLEQRLEAAGQPID